MADETALIARLAKPGARVEVVKTSTEQDLTQRFGRLAASKSLFRHILVIGHSNECGLCLTADRFVPWTVFARWVAAFQPKHVALMACQAGLPIPIVSLFNEIPTLMEIYASPLIAYKNHVQVMKALVPYLMHAKSPNNDLIVTGQFVNFICTRGVIIRWRRQDIKLATLIRDVMTGTLGSDG